MDAIVEEAMPFVGGNACDRMGLSDFGGMAEIIGAGYCMVVESYQGGGISFMSGSLGLGAVYNIEAGALDAANDFWVDYGNVMEDYYRGLDAAAEIMDATIASLGYPC